MNATPDATDSGSADESADTPNRLRFELIFASVALAFGLFVLPALIYAVGSSMLGPYGEEPGLGRFYADFFGDLAEPSGRAWAIAIGPALIIYLLRAVFAGAPTSSRPLEAEWERSPAVEPAQKQRVEPSRREPRVSLD